MRERENVKCRLKNWNEGTWKVDCEIGRMKM